MLDFLKIKNNIFILILLFVGCATTYHPKNIFGGYESRQIGPNTFEVKFTGNQHTPEAKINNFLFYHCAELTAENKYTHFVILSNKSYTTESDIEPEFTVPFITRSSLSAGNYTVANPDFTVKTDSENFTGFYIIALFNNSDPPFQKVKYLGQDAQQIIKKMKSIVN